MGLDTDQLGGWLVIGVFLVLFVPTVILLQGAEKVITVIESFGALLSVCLLTGDPPG